MIDILFAWQKTVLFFLYCHSVTEYASRSSGCIRSREPPRKKGAFKGVSHSETLKHQFFQEPLSCLLVMLLTFLSSIPLHFFWSPKLSSCYIGDFSFFPSSSSSSVLVLFCSFLFSAGIVY